MCYFENVKVDDVVYGLVFGKGVVTSAYKDSYYTFEVTYVNDQVVPYTADGYPAWDIDGEEQTVYYKKDIVNYLCDSDITPLENVLTIPEIINLRDRGMLLSRCPSGIWRNTKECPSGIIERYLTDMKLHLFKQAPFER